MTPTLALVLVLVLVPIPAVALTLLLVAPVPVFTLLVPLDTEFGVAVEEEEAELLLVLVRLGFVSLMACFFGLPSSHALTCEANLKEQTLSLKLSGVGDKFTIIKVFPSPLNELWLLLGR